MEVDKVVHSITRPCVATMHKSARVTVRVTAVGVLQVSHLKF